MFCTNSIWCQRWGLGTFWEAWYLSCSPCRLLVPASSRSWSPWRPRWQSPAGGRGQSPVGRTWCVCVCVHVWCKRLNLIFESVVYDVCASRISPRSKPNFHWALQRPCYAPPHCSTLTSVPAPSSPFPHLEIGLDGVVHNGLLAVILGHQGVDGEVVDGGLEVRLLSVNHHPHTSIWSTLSGRDASPW